ncbi:MAG: hypothetical protein A2Z25_06820 [Planctomycetes bacterium RBG_16_55_9]|nr:MAG: hypothetical protein A2Z25_06820 [Planctomycetes bacterium RBG_16_55_9]
MKRLRFKPVLQLVVLSMVSVSLLGCSGTLEQEAQTVRVSPVSEQYKLDQKLQGKTYILVAETSTGQEQYRYAVSDSLARAMKEGGKCAPNVEGIAAIPFLGADSRVEVARICDASHEVLSFTDFANRLNEKGLGYRHAEMKKFYKENGMFRKADLQFLAEEIGADYLVLPCLLDIRRWSQGRLSVGGVKFLNTQIVSGMLGMEIWDTKAGRKVFSATSDLTIANEKIREQPISVEEAFERAWLGIISQLPGQLPAGEGFVADGENDSPKMNEHAEANTEADEKKEPEGGAVGSLVGMLVCPPKGL